MPSIRDIVGDSGVESLHAVVESGGSKYLCFTRLTDENWLVAVSDGCEMWRLELDADDLETYRDIADVTTIDIYLARFK